MTRSLHRDAPPAPWYRQFWPWFLIALPASVVTASMFTIWLAARSPNPMVVDDYSRINRSTEQRRERDLAAAALGLEAAIRVVPGAGLVELELFPASVQPEGLQLRLSHPLVAERDQVIELVRTPSGWSGALPPLEGRWYVQLYPRDGGWRLAGELAGETELRLVPPTTP